MKAFRYPLHPVLSLRRRQESAALEAYARQLEARRRAADAADFASRALDSLWNEQRLAGARGCPAADFERFRIYGLHLQQARVSALNVLAAADRSVGQALRDLVSARQRREALEKHRDHARDDHDHAVFAAETRALDDLAARTTRPSLTSPSEPLLP